MRLFKLPLSGSAIAELAASLRGVTGNSMATVQLQTDQHLLTTFLMIDQDKFTTLYSYIC